VRALRALHGAVTPLVVQHGGMIINTVGDSLLAEFASVLGAVRCGVAIQHENGSRNEAVAEAQRMQLRIGVTQGEIVVSGDDRYGDGVNVAARLQALARPGGIAISGRVHEDVASKLDLEWQDAGEQVLKNIDRPVRVWQWHPMPVAGEPPQASSSLVGPAAGGRVPTVAVPPIRNLNPGDDQSLLCEGIANEMIVALSRFRGLRVLARSSSFALGAEGAQPGTAAANVDFVVETSMRRNASRLRLQVGLLDMRERRSLWAETFDVEAEELVGLEDRIAASIAATLDHEVTEATFKHLLARKDGRFGAFECWLRGQHSLYHNDWTPEGEQQAMEWFERALAIDPHFARAHSSLALVLNTQPFVKPGLAPGTLPEEALDHARKAIEYDDGDARSHLAMAFVALTARDRRRAERHFALAASLNPNSADVLINCALGAAELGDAGKARDLADRALALNPTYPAFYEILLTRIRLHECDYAGALEVGKAVATMVPDLPAWLAAAAALTGESALANEYARRFLAMAEERWSGTLPFTGARAVDWVLAINGFDSDDHLRAMRKGLTLAGLPTP
jgi:TolB-like protein